ncbi:YhgE/Pip family protein [Microbacterium ulmi]|uniref:Uncharacterized protein n=1 Tax=Microbacterium ulmi TaxID=179095 RepID=A0A7Y2M2M8_9MICO|nr:YhgE/Pip family protein [Microbacterium ulmi]NII68788.1 putative membrane protein [Microbacterium ulmi]NNH05385.1 hypothetical protein [Microbacterium ulmi]
MTLPIERSRTRRPITWLTLVGVLLLPAVIGGILVAALYNPVERLEGLTAAIVNEDEPVTIDGQYAPLGRQLAAGLVEGSDDVPSNLTWTISNASDAAAGLADGRYSAVVTIPENFSAAATSTRPGETPERATIGVQTPPDSLIVDDAITAQVTQAAASLMGRELSRVYLENVFLGFTTLGDQLGQAADGATTWADGARDAATGAVSLADGVRQLSSGASRLSDGAAELSSGASALSSGAAQWASGAGMTADGLDRWAAGAGKTAGGTRGLADGLSQMADQVAQLPAVPQEIVDGADMIAENSGQIKASVSDAAAQLSQLSARCDPAVSGAEMCDGLAAVAQQANDALPTVNDVLDQSGTIAQQVSGLAQFGPQLTQGLRDATAGATSLANGMDELATGAADTAGGARRLASGASGISSGIAKLASGASTWASGASAWASGANDAATGADGLSTGLGQLADGADALADGLHTASDALPSYSNADARSLADVVSSPVAASGVGTTLFGASAIPLLAMLALWFGGLATFVALRAVSQRTLTSRAPSALLALRALAPAAGIGALQGLLVAVVVQLAASYEWGSWAVFAAVSMVAGVAFAAVNQGLNAVFNGAGRWISALVGVLAVATGVVSTVPGVLSSIAAVLPTSPAYNAMLAGLGPATGVWAGLVGLLVWGLLAFAATVVTVARRRTVSARALLTASPAPV